jgi:phosphohistidine phosphatase
MSSRLFIMRHGEAGPGYPDSERELTARGHAEAERVSTWLAQQSLHGGQLFTSPYRRARETAAHLAEALQLEPMEHAAITPDDSPAAVCDWLLDMSASQPIVLVSHMPLVGLLAGLLVEGRADRGLGFPTAGVAELEGEVWAAGCARLLRFIGPHDIS